MRAKLIKEDLSDLLKPKSLKDIEKEYESNKIKDHFEVLKNSINQLSNDVAFSEVARTFDDVKQNFIETVISDYFKKELNILFIVAPNNHPIAYINKDFHIKLLQSHSGYSYQAKLWNKGFFVDETIQCRNMRTLKAKILKLLKTNNVSI